MTFCNQCFTYHDVQDLKYWKLFSTNHLNRSQQFQCDSNILKQNPINTNISLLNSLKLKYLDNFNTNYIIWNVEFFFFKERNFVKKNIKSFSILKNIVLFDMKSSYLINYLMYICLNCPYITIYFQLYNNFTTFFIMGVVVKQKNVMDKQIGDILNSNITKTMTSTRQWKPLPL